MSAKKRNDLMKGLVSGLPEIYQPVFGRPELSMQVSRPCCDRLQDIVKVHDALQKTLGRPLKVLDLGCAQGFFSFSLAERGAEVHGVDYLDKNIAVCVAIAEEHPEFKVRFEIGRIELVIQQLEQDQYDLVLGLSIFHHIIHERGVEDVKALLNRVVAKSLILLIETALQEEPLYWAPSQPKEARSLFDKIAFVRELARHKTHLSPIPRPLYAVSNRCWVLGGKVGWFETWTENPHIFARGTHEGSRRYFFSPELIVKKYCFDHPRGQLNRTEFNREVCFFKRVPAGFPAPMCYAIESCETEGWVVFERIHGRLLLDVLLQGDDVDYMNIFRSILEQLVVLENAELYHNDVRLWNVMIKNDGGVVLIDCGAISSEKKDCAWPSNIFFSFFSFVGELIFGVSNSLSSSAGTGCLMRSIFTPRQLPTPYDSWMAGFLQGSVADWSFKSILRELDATAKPSECSEFSAEDIFYLKCFENAVQVLTESCADALKQLRRHLDCSEADRAARLEVIERQGRDLGDLRSQLACRTSEADELRRHLDCSEADRAARLEVIERQGRDLGDLRSQLACRTDEADELQKKYTALRAHWWWRIARFLRFADTVLDR
jgi:O-antigen chain-terminating methyltransferase